jgi:hypothetical protein
MKWRSKTIRDIWPRITKSTFLVQYKVYLLQFNRYNIVQSVKQDISNNTGNNNIVHAANKID